MAEEHLHTFNHWTNIVFRVSVGSCCLAVVCLIATKGDIHLCASGSGDAAHT